MGFPGGTVGKESTCKVKDLGSIPGLGRSPGGGHGNPLQYSCLENPYGFCSPPPEEPGELQSVGSQRVGHDWATKHSATCHNKWPVSQKILRNSYRTHCGNAFSIVRNRKAQNVGEQKEYLQRLFFFSLPATPFLIPCFRMIVCLSKCVWQLGKHKRKNKDKNHLRMTSVVLLCLNFVIRLGFCSEL